MDPGDGLGVREIIEIDICLAAGVAGVACTHDAAVHGYVGVPSVDLDRTVPLYQGLGVRDELSLVGDLDVSARIYGIPYGYDRFGCDLGLDRDGPAVGQAVAYMHLGVTPGGSHETASEYRTADRSR